GADTADTNAADTALPDTAPDTAGADGTDTAGDTAPDTGGPDTAPDTSADSGGPDTDSDAASPACGPDDRQACLYRTGRSHEVELHEPPGLTYTDLIGETRNVNIVIYRPVGAPTPMPVVLLSHGGASGKSDPMKSMENWAPVLAEAGYFAVAIAHEGRDESSYDALCEELDVNPLHECGIKISWDRPNDVARVLAFLDERSRTGQFAGLFDMERIAHMGHSAGASAALVSIGATRNFTCALPFGFEDPDQDCRVEDLVSQALDEIDVAVSMSPQGPGQEGFMVESFATVTRPFLMGTGANDGSEGEPANRAALFPLVPAGDKYKLFVDDQGAKHTLFEGSLEACTPIAGQQKCTQMRAAIFSTALAFLDAYMLDRAAARSWLASDDLETAGSGLFDLERR
ncbi:MAG TPA: hypothetical protein PK095_18255, partial [Myxococcota bacterium]|nr:hypothetical protein [Myxococcota bacterium]